MMPDTSNTQTRGRGAVDARLERARAARVEVGHLVDRAAATGGRFHAEAGRAGDDRHGLRSGGAQRREAEG